MTIELTAYRTWHPKLGIIIRPASEFDTDKIAGLRDGGVIALAISTRDAPKARRFYFGLIGKLVEAGLWPHRDLADTDLMVRLGRVGSTKLSVAADGTETYRLLPVSRSEWTVIEWQEFLRAAVECVTTEILPKLLWPKVRTEIERYCGVGLADVYREAAL